MQRLHIRRQRPQNSDPEEQAETLEQIEAPITEALQVKAQRSRFSCEDHRCQHQDWQFDSSRIDEDVLDEDIKIIKCGRCKNYNSQISISERVLEMERLEQSYNMETLEKYGTDLTKLAKEGRFDPIIGREEQIERVVISIDMGRLTAGAWRVGDFEERLMNVIDKVKGSNGGIILFIDELHTLIGAGRGWGALDAANIMKPALARGELKCIGATTLDEYKKYIEKDPALERRFQCVKVPEPSVDETIKILKGLSPRYETYHNVRYANEALESAARLSHRYISDRFLPDKAIDIIDKAGSRVCLYQTRELGTLPVVKEMDIRHIVSSSTGIPVDKVSCKDTEHLLKMEKTLHNRVIGQYEAVDAVSRAIIRARVGIRDSNHPIATFFFTGPKGVGKTKLANVLASEYFGSKDSMIRLDMSEFYDRHTVAKLIGSPPGYINSDEGGRLTEAVRRRPHALILFDEIEKAHTNVFNIMLQIMGEGRLTDGKGRTVDFKNTMLIITSNVSTIIGKGGQANTKVVDELKKVFRPEFLNRLDEVIIFRQLTKTNVRKIVNVMLEELCERLKEKHIELVANKKFKEKVAEEGYSPIYGARPLKRTITRLLEDKLAKKMLIREIKEGDQVYLDVNSQGYVVVNKKFVKGKDNEDCSSN
ncbi:hypothetical protein GIB67_041892 [Kingdonia uniflora]|uniref:Uncharacterized protein n=1 Tax=Kingdonia uniflora TaxID=39325 RepID=A0A7J7L637_9MAGN|nr:hypothetical protein GIB67_041892 [Kingdonia uniflora]